MFCHLHYIAAFACQQLKKPHHSQDAFSFGARALDRKQRLTLTVPENVTDRPGQFITSIYFIIVILAHESIGWLLIVQPHLVIG